MAHQSGPVDFEFQQISSDCYRAIVTISNELATSLYQEAIRSQKDEAQTFGFEKGKTPLFYIEHNYKTNIAEHLNSFLFHYVAFSSLYKNICEKKFILANEPEFESVEIEPGNKAVFSFLLDTMANDFDPYGWKNINFKAPQRKNYKDIDRQVESFIEQESSVSEEVSHQVGIGDWVCFDIKVLNHDKQPLYGSYKEKLWLKIGNEEIDREMQDLFVGKKVGDQFITNAQTFQEYFSDRIDTYYSFDIEICYIVSNTHFSLESLKKHFGIKSAKDLHKKLIEVFSFRNDLSQRRETIEKAFKQLINYYKLKPYPFLVEQQQARVLKAVQQNPDYYVYKSEKNFKQMVKQLAEKQLKEAVIVDFIRCHENVNIHVEDVAYYLTLMQRPRTKMFLYFGLPSTKVRGQEMPISHEFLHHICLREKTLNHIINTFTRKK